MKKIHIADDPIFIGFLKSLLEAEGIACIVRNELLIGGAGELPPNECWPELWVLHEADQLAARAIVDRAVLKSAENGEMWLCHHCDEQCEHQFTACWRCGSLRR